MKNSGLLAEQLQKRKKGMNERLVVNITESQQKVIDGLILYLRAKEKKNNTIARYEYTLRRFLQFAGEGFEFEKATREDIQRIMGKVNGSDLASASKLKMKIHIKVLYKWLLGNDETYPSQVSWIKTTDKGTSKVLTEHLLTEDEIRRMLDTAIGLRNKAMIATLYDAGLRIGELLNMKKRDVHLDKEPVSITVNGKTGVRIIPVYLSAPYLSQYIDSIAAYDVDSPLWSRYIKRRNCVESLDGNGVRKILREVASEANIKKRIYPHLFRHSRASYYANRLTEQQLKRYFGWTATSDMASVYVHLSGRDIDNAILQANGEKPLDTLAPTLTKIKCPRCKRDNGLTNNHCYICGAELHVSQTDMARNEAEIQQEVSLFLKISQNPDALKTLLDITKLSKEDKKRIIESL